MLHKELGIEMATIVNVGQMKFRADKFWKAIEKTFQYGHARVHTMNDDRRVEIYRSKEREYSITLNGASKEYITDPTFGIIKSSIDERRKLLEAYPEWLDMPADKRNSEINRIIMLQSHVERIKALGDLRDSSAAFFYYKLMDKFSGERKLAFNEFNPPSLNSLLDHLRLSKVTSSTFSRRLDLAAEVLLEESGPEFAFFRLAGLPIALPQPIIKTLLGMSAENRKTILDAVIGESHTPMQLIHALFLCQVLTGNEGYDRLNEIIDRLLASWSYVSNAFIAILRWTEATLEDYQGWTSLNAEERLALIWTHADRILDILILKNIDLDFAAKTFLENYPKRSIAELMRLLPAYDGASANPQLVDQTSLLFHGIGYVLDGKDAKDVLRQQHLVKLQSLMTMISGDTPLVSPWLYVCCLDNDNEFGSFLTQRPKGIFDPAVEPSLEACVQSLENALANLESFPLSSDAWLLLWTFSRSGMTCDSKDRLNHILRNIDFIELAKHAPDNTWILKIIGYSAILYSDSDVINHLEEQIILLAMHYSKTYPGKTTFSNSEISSSAENAINQLWEGAASLAKRESISEAMTNLGRLLVRIATAWPGSASVPREFIGNAIAHLKNEDSLNLLDSWIALRSLP